MGEKFLLEMKGISKRFGGVRALDKVDFHLREGTVHALMGENGAGKSTLMKILLGLYQPDEGEIIYQGKEIILKGPQHALDIGFAMVSQELTQMEEMTVADNIFMGRFPGKLAVNRKEINQKTRTLFEDLGIKGIQPGEKVKMLSQARKQLVEIAKAVSYDAKVIVMDEPTSALMDKEVEILFRIINDLKSRGKAIIYISHKMEEIFRISDDITVLRDGTFIGTQSALELDNDTLVKMMVGRELKDLFVRNRKASGDVVLEVKNLSAPGAFENVSFQVRRGEVVGFAGLMGSGRSEIMETIFGIRKKSGGTVCLNGEEIQIRSPKDAINKKIAFVTEDRKGTGLFLNMPILFNSSISYLDILTKHFTVPKKKEAAEVKDISDRLKLKRGSIKNKASSLSGGNQQKVVLAKWLLTQPDLLILDEPTRGIDVGAKKEIYTLIDEIVAEGKAVIVISSEMPEVIGVSDRILVMHEGRMKGEIDNSGAQSATQEQIMSLMTD